MEGCQEHKEWRDSRGSPRGAPCSAVAIGEFDRDYGGSPNMQNAATQYLFCTQTVPLGERSKPVVGPWSARGHQELPWPEIGPWSARGLMHRRTALINSQLQPRNHTTGILINSQLQPLMTHGS